MTFDSIKGRRVTLREHGGKADTVEIAPWLEEIVAAAGISEPVLQDPTVQQPVVPSASTAPGGRFGVLIIERIGEPGPVGFLEYAVAQRSLNVAFIGLAKPYRGWGYGSEAVRLLEEWALREGIARRFRAEVDVRNGLGLYFWLRLGYRPGAGVGGVLAMERTLN
jgi:RimJ/RimL family protein N-acetyltransferase